MTTGWLAGWGENTQFLLLQETDNIGCLLEWMENVGSEKEKTFH
jgi:hypothetical protein